MTDKTKKIIAREGLVIIAIITVGVFINFIGSFIGIKEWYGHSIESIIWFPIFYGYLSYILLIRFIIWAIRTVKEK